MKSEPGWCGGYRLSPFVSPKKTQSSPGVPLRNARRPRPWLLPWSDALRSDRSPRARRFWRARGAPKPSDRKLFAGLLCHHVFRVPFRPVLVALTAVALLVLAMGLRRAPQRGSKIRPGSVEAVVSESIRPGKRVVISCSSHSLPSGPPNVGERGIAAPLGIAPLDRRLAETCAVKRLADLGAMADELGARRFDVRHDKIKSTCRAGSRRGDPGAEVDRGRRARGVNCTPRNVSPTTKSPSSRQPRPL